MSGNINCINCGAKLEPRSGADRNCAYCGTYYPAGLVLENAEKPVQERPVSDPLKNGCGIAFFLACLLLVILALANKNGCLQQRSPEYGEDYQPVIDSGAIVDTSVAPVAVDTVTAVMKKPVKKIRGKRIGNRIMILTSLKLR